MEQQRRVSRTKRSRRWDGFADKVAAHIDDYTVPQYGDEGDDLASEYTAEKCVDQVKKYLGRFGRNSRPGQDELDIVKAAHYLQMAHDLIGVSHQPKSLWSEWDKIQAQPGDKIAIVGSDGCSAATALVVDMDTEGGRAVLHGEDGVELSSGFLKGSLWVKLPDDFALRFTELED
jgi:hypothetical protein